MPKQPESELTSTELVFVRMLKKLLPASRKRITEQFCCRCGLYLHEPDQRGIDPGGLDWANHNRCHECSPDPRD